MAVSIATTGGTHSYATSFPTVEDPLSEGAKWLNGAVDGTDWLNVKATVNGAQPAAASSTYDDPTAILKSSAVAFDADQRATGVVYLNGTPAGTNEIELRLRSALSAGSNTGYEFLWAANGDYVQIVRWNGDLGDFTYLSSLDGSASSLFALSDGDVIEARAIGPLLLQYLNGKLINWAVDTMFASGQPGIGFYGDYPEDIGLKSIAFSDDVPQIGGLGGADQLDFAFPGTLAAGVTVVVGIAAYERTPPATALSKLAGTCTLEAFTRDGYLAGASGHRGLASYSARVTAPGTLTVRYADAGYYCGLGGAALVGVKAADRVGTSDTNAGTGTTHTTNSLANAAGSALLYVDSEAATTIQLREHSDSPVAGTEDGAHAFTFGVQLKLASGSPNTLTDVFAESVSWEALAVEYLADPVVPAGAVAVYAFDEGAGMTSADASGNGHTLDLVGTPAWETGHSGSGKALSFDGSTYAVATGYAVDLAQFTVMCWLKSPDAPGDIDTACPLWRDTNYAINWDSSAGAFKGAFVAKTTSWIAISFGELLGETYYHLCATYDGDQIIAYKNGVFVNESGSLGALASSAAELTFAYNPNIPSRPKWPGVIDDVRIYDRVLTVDEIIACRDTPVAGLPNLVGPLPVYLRL